MKWWDELDDEVSPQQPVDPERMDYWNRKVYEEDLERMAGLQRLVVGLLGIAAVLVVLVLWLFWF